MVVMALMQLEQASAGTWMIAEIELAAMRPVTSQIFAFNPVSG
jgi:hypothetical protein